MFIAPALEKHGITYNPEPLESCALNWRFPNPVERAVELLREMGLEPEAMLGAGLQSITLSIKGMPHGVVRLDVGQTDKISDLLPDNNSMGPAWLKHVFRHDFQMDDDTIIMRVVPKLEEFVTPEEKEAARDTLISATAAQGEAWKDYAANYPMKLSGKPVIHDIGFATNGCGTPDSPEQVATADEIRALARNQTAALNILAEETRALLPDGLKNQVSVPDINTRITVRTGAAPGGPKN